MFNFCSTPRKQHADWCASSSTNNANNNNYCNDARYHRDLHHLGDHGIKKPRIDDGDGQLGNTVTTPRNLFTDNNYNRTMTGEQWQQRNPFIGDDQQFCDTSGVHDMSGVIQEQQQQQDDGQRDHRHCCSSTFDDELFRFQLQNAFQEISDQINRVGTHLAQQMDFVLSKLQLAAQAAPSFCRKRRHPSSPPSSSSSASVHGKMKAAAHHCFSHHPGRCHVLDCSDGIINDHGNDTDTATLIQATNTAQLKPQLMMLGAGRVKLKAVHRRPQFRCPHCLRRRFHHQSMLIDHIRRNHHHVNKKRATAERAQRPCDNLMSLLSQLTEQQQREQRSTMTHQFGCAVCGELFKKSRLLDKHLVESRHAAVNGLPQVDGH